MVSSHGKQFHHSDGQRQVRQKGIGLRLLGTRHGPRSIRNTAVQPCELREGLLKSPLVQESTKHRFAGTEETVKQLQEWMP